MCVEEIIRFEKPCFCGKGSILVVNKREGIAPIITIEHMLCQNCKDNYVYATYDMWECSNYISGWLSKNEFEKRLLEEKQRKIILCNLKEKYYELWIAKFRGISKYQINKILCEFEIFNCSYSTFCNITTKYKKEKVLEYLGSLFRYCLLGKILIFLEVNESEWTSIVQDEKYIEEIKLQITEYKIRKG